MATARFIKKFENGGVALPDIIPGPERVKSKVDDAYRRAVPSAAKAASAQSAASVSRSAQQSSAARKTPAAAGAAPAKPRNVPGVTSADTSDVRELKRIIAEKEREIQGLLVKMAELTTRLDRVVYTLDPQK